MASSFFALFDDIATLLDDVAVLSKVAAKKTSGVLGDDLALNAQQVAGVRADRELPVVWAVAVGSMRNKVILVPSALAISAFAPVLITPLLVVGGLYLCFEGVEKIAHSFFHKSEPKLALETVDETVDIVALEKDKIRGAIRTDFVLSAEIIVITLGTVALYPFRTKALVLCAIAILMTIGVYGFVAAIVKIDDLGLWLHQKKQAIARLLGRALLVTAPLLMKFLSVLGTIAMFLVGGGIVLHGIPHAHHLLEPLRTAVPNSPALGFLFQSGVELVTGVLAGSVVLGLVALAKRFKKPAPHNAS